MRVDCLPDPVVVAVEIQGQQVDRAGIPVVDKKPVDVLAVTQASTSAGGDGHVVLQVV